MLRKGKCISTIIYTLPYFQKNILICVRSWLIGRKGRYKGKRGRWIRLRVLFIKRKVLPLHPQPEWKGHQARWWTGGERRRVRNKESLRKKDFFLWQIWSKENKFLPLQSRPQRTGCLGNPWCGAWGRGNRSDLWQALNKEIDDTKQRTVV